MIFASRSWKAQFHDGTPHDRTTREDVRTTREEDRTRDLVRELHNHRIYCKTSLAKYGNISIWERTKVPVLGDDLDKTFL